MTLPHYQCRKGVSLGTRLREAWHLLRVTSETLAMDTWSREATGNACVQRRTSDMFQLDREGMLHWDLHLSPSWGGRLQGSMSGGGMVMARDVVSVELASWRRRGSWVRLPDRSAWLCGSVVLERMGAQVWVLDVDTWMRESRLGDMESCGEAGRDWDGRGWIVGARQVARSVSLQGVTR